MGLCYCICVRTFFPPIFGSVDVYQCSDPAHCPRVMAAWSNPLQECVCVPVEIMLLISQWALSTNGSIKEGQRVYYASLDYLMYSLSWDLCACATLILASWKKSGPDLYSGGGNISACVASCFTKSPPDLWLKLLCGIWWGADARRGVMEVQIIARCEESWESYFLARNSEKRNTFSYFFHMKRWEGQRWAACVPVFSDTLCFRTIWGLINEELYNAWNLSNCNNCWLLTRLFSLHWFKLGGNHFLCWKYQAN